jgi:ceramidase
MVSKRCSDNQTSASALHGPCANLATLLSGSGRDGRMPVRISKWNTILALTACIAVGLFLIFAPPLRQIQGYHDFADRRTMFGIPNFWDVISNLPFLVIGLFGLRRFHDQASRILFLGVFFTAIGSAYYHLAPDNARLFWDRLPMTIAFMSVFALAINRPRLTVPFVLLGFISVVWWRVTDNLWLYGLVQFGTMAALLLIAARRELGLWPVFIFYGLSKITEHFDKQIYSILPLSGHTIKHLLAGIATWYVYDWIRSSRSELPDLLEQEREIGIWEAACADHRQPTGQSRHSEDRRKSIPATSPRTSSLLRSSQNRNGVRNP